MEEGGPILSPGTTAPWHRAVGIMQNKQKSQTENIFQGMKSADKTQLLCSKEHAEAQGLLQGPGPSRPPCPYILRLAEFKVRVPLPHREPRGHESGGPLPCAVPADLLSGPPQTSSPACSLQLLQHPPPPRTQGSESWEPPPQT